LTVVPVTVAAEALAAVAMVGAMPLLTVTLPKVAVDVAVVLCELTANPICGLPIAMVCVLPICVQVIPSTL
jgi:hypothetical protein